MTSQFTTRKNYNSTPGWHWHQLDHMQTICTLLQTDASTSSL